MTDSTRKSGKITRMDGKITRSYGINYWREW